MIGSTHSRFLPNIEVIIEKCPVILAITEEMHSRDSQEKEIPESMDIEGPSTSTDEPEPKFFDRGSKKSRKRHRKDSDSEMNRPPTPTEVIQQREVEWSERQRQRQEKHRRRQTESDADYWNNDVLAENESIVKFGNLIDQIFEQVEDMDVLQSEEAGVLTDRVQLEELRIEGQKLKAWRKLNKFNTDRLIKLLTLLEKSISDVLSEDGSLIVSYITNEADDESDETYRELINERLVRAADAACTALTIMTAPRMPKQVLIEDTIERAVQMCKQFLQHIVYPSSDVVCRTGSKAKRVSDDRVKKRKSAFDSSVTSQMIYTRMAELISCFSELVRFQNLNETVIIQLCTLATGPFFVDNIGEIQMQSIKLISTIFSRYAGMRKSILQDLLNSLHRLPSMKNQKNCYRLSNADTIHNFTVLILQLVQSIVKLPIKKRTSDEENDEQNDILPEDTAVIDSYEEAQKMAAFFLGGFLTKCTAKSEDDYRRLFEQFLRDLLASLYRPEWPVAEMMLTILGNLLVKYYRSKMEISLRVASLEYLGTITARLRKDKVSAMNDANSTFEKTRLDLVVKGILFDEQVDQTKTLDEIDTSNLSSSDKMRKIEQALIDYIIGSRGDGDVSVEYAIMFYVGEWYKETVEDMEMAKERHRQFTQEDHPEKEVRKHERKLQKLMEKGENMKSFVLSLADKKHLKKRHQYIMKTGNIMIDSDALWAVKYLASKREFSQSFNNYLKMILYGVQLEPAVQLRTKAMKCLTQIIEADHEVLLMADVHNAVQARMTDTNVAVREATIELIGKYLVSRPDLLNKYYTILMERIKDTGVAVRKRVIRILREIVEKQPDIDKVPEILARIIRRITDEEGIKKLCIETFQNIWFVPVNERSSELLLKKVTTMADTIEVCVSENMSEYFETLVGAILKNNSDKSAIHACRQIVDCLIDNILTLDSKVVDEGQKFENANSETNSTVTRTSLGRLLASLTTLSAFCKIRPELMVKHAEVLLPYLSTISSSSSSELQVLNQVINMLERVVPLMDHPSDTFLSTLDERLGLLIRDKGMVIIASAVACMSASFKKWRKPKPAICEIFLLYLKYLNNVRSKIEAMPTYKLPEAKKPTIMRFLYTLGLSIRHFNFDEILVDDEEAKASAKSLDSAALKGSIPAGDDDSNNGSENRIFCNLVYSILLFNSRSSDSGIRLKALTALGNMTAEYTDFLTRQEIRNMYIFCLQAEEPSYLPNKIQVLKNLSMFLQSEEQKAIKTNEQMQQLKNKEAEDLKEMELHTSGLSAAIIQIYWNPVMNCYFHPQEEVRTSVVQVVWQTLQQGLVTPGSSIPTLISMSTDSLPNIRTKVENLLKEIDTKYAGMVPSKAVIGVRMSFRLQKYIKRDSNKIIRGIRQCEHSAGATLDQNGLPKSVNDGQAILGGLYSMLRMNRQQRRSFLSALLRLFSENSTEKLGLEEWVFVADNLAMFPYQVLDEPLYVIHQAELITSTTGQDILSGLKQLLLPRRISQTGQPEDDDEEFTSEIIYRRLPEDKSKIYELMRKSHACFLLLYIKTFLMKLYGFNESKVQEYSPSEAAKVYEKPVTRKNVSVFNPEMTLQELLPGVIATRDTIEGHINLSQQIVYFRNMLLSLDKMDYDEDEEEMDQESSTLLEKTDVNNETAEPIEEE
uniref:Nipped-B protein n=1 Tax=Acrobeloides nanus TaxID=290746 RepID=A0A914CW65_9BILA